MQNNVNSFMSEGSLDDVIFLAKRETEMYNEDPVKAKLERLFAARENYTEEEFEELIKGMSCYVLLEDKPVSGAILVTRGSGALAFISKFEAFKYMVDNRCSGKNVRNVSVERLLRHMDVDFIDQNYKLVRKPQNKDVFSFEKEQRFEAIELSDIEDDYIDIQVVMPDAGNKYEIMITMVMEFDMPQEAVVDAFINAKNNETCVINKLKRENGADIMTRLKQIGCLVKCRPSVLTK